MKKIMKASTVLSCESDRSTLAIGVRLCPSFKFEIPEVCCYQFTHFSLEEPSISCGNFYVSLTNRKRVIWGNFCIF